MWKTQSCEVCDFCILLYNARESVTTFSKSGNAFPRVIQKYTKVYNVSCLVQFLLLGNNYLKIIHFTLFFIYFSESADGKSTNNGGISSVSSQYATTGPTTATSDSRPRQNSPPPLPTSPPPRDHYSAPPPRTVRYLKHLAFLS